MAAPDHRLFTADTVTDSSGEVKTVPSVAQYMPAYAANFSSGGAVLFPQGEWRERPSCWSRAAIGVSTRQRVLFAAMLQNC